MYIYIHIHTRSSFCMLQPQDRSRLIDALFFYLDSNQAAVFCCSAPLGCFNGFVRIILIGVIAVSFTLW